MYLEIGVSTGETFFAVRADKKVAVDPLFRFSLDEARRSNGDSEFHEVTSDRYFSEIIDQGQKFDIIYLDGLHTFEQTLRDFTNSIHFLKTDGIIVIDDVIPNSYQAALPDQADAFVVKAFTENPDNSWMGDTFKLVFFIRAFFPTYNIRTIADNHGQAVVWRGSRATADIFNLNIDDLARLQFIDVIKQLSVFRKAPFSEIISLIREEQSRLPARSEDSRSLTSDRAPEPGRKQSRMEGNTKAFRIQRLGQLAKERVPLAPALELSIKRAAVYDNISEFDAAFARHIHEDIYCDRIAKLDAIELVRLQSATILAGGDYITISEGAAVKEQIPPWRESDAELALTNLGDAETVSSETVIVARYGAWTWGHWLGELLPKIVMVETAFPGRFSFAVPATHDVPRWRPLRELMAAYGVTEDRLLPLEPERSYHLAQAWGVTPVWSDHLMHPAATSQMRERLPRQALFATAGPKVAVTRPPGEARHLENWDQIAGLLVSKGFRAVDPLELNFREQVGVFGSADTVFSVLGSGLTGLIYAPVGVQVASVAPAVFGDRFFYALVTDRNGCYADIRGPVRKLDAKIPHRSSFTVDPARVEAGLQALYMQ